MKLHKTLNIKLINFMRFYFLLLCSLLFFSYSVVMATEEINYKIISKNNIFEIRKYTDRLAVEAITTNQNNSFRKLFNYISGNNQSKQEIQMTTPVTRIEKDGSMTMQFYLPAKFDQNNAPNPLSSDVKLVNIEGGHYAVLIYSGRSSDDNFVKYKNILKEEIIKNNILIKSPAVRATYNSPFTLPAFRRNEVMFKVNYE